MFNPPIFGVVLVNFHMASGNLMPGFVQKQSCCASRPLVQPKVITSLPHTVSLRIHMRISPDFPFVSAVDSPVRHAMNNKVFPYLF